MHGNSSADSLGDCTASQGEWPQSAISRRGFGFVEVAQDIGWTPGPEFAQFEQNKGPATGTMTFVPRIAIVYNRALVLMLPILSRRCFEIAP
ncbi:MAG: hypothetical protein CMJ64_14020 [Planctomycetaceae bacterium]|nr:hypothetical protein [Planctomycetaceae bacterium]